MTDHDAIAAKVRQDRETGTPGPWVHDDQLPQWINMRDDNGAVWNVATAHVCCGHPVDGSAANARRIAALPDLEAAYLDLYDEVKRLRADLEQGQLDYCDLMTRHDAHFVAWQSAKSRAEEAEAERDALRAALEEIADGLKGIARDIQIGPDDEGRDIYEMALAIRDDARAALKGDSDE